MKRFISYVSILLLFSCYGSSYKYYSGSFEEALKEAGSKLVLLKFYTNTWAACIRLDVETLRNPEVQAFSEQNFISLKSVIFKKDYNHLASGGKLINIASIFPSVFSPNNVPLS